MNLALFSISRLRLEVEAELGDRHASKILKMRRDSKFLLTTVLWGNVGINVLLTLLSNLVLAGVSAPMENHLPVFPNFEDTTTDPFLENIEVSGKKRVIITDNEGEPQFALDSDGFLRDVLFGDSKTMPFRYCHRPIVVKDTRLPLGDVFWRLKSILGKPAGMSSIAILF